MVAVIRRLILVSSLWQEGERGLWGPPARIPSGAQNWPMTTEVNLIPARHPRLTGCNGRLTGTCYGSESNQ
jgi:hypothetical protein